MKHIIQETIIRYRAEDLADWKVGKKEAWLSGPLPTHVANQPKYHFGEYYVLSHFKAARWSGHRFYALGTWEPTNEKIAAGRADIAKCFSHERLSAFRQARTQIGRSDGKGESDLFLFMDQGQTLFLEVKKGGDRLSEAQLQCMAQIKAILGSEVGVVYLATFGQQYKPKRFELDLTSYVGRRLDD